MNGRPNRACGRPLDPTFLQLLRYLVRFLAKKATMAAMSATSAMPPTMATGIMSPVVGVALPELDVLLWFWLLEALLTVKVVLAVPSSKLNTME